MIQIFLMFLQIKKKNLVMDASSWLINQVCQLLKRPFLKLANNVSTVMTHIYAAEVSLSKCLKILLIIVPVQ